MDTYADERYARANLGWLREPGDARLRQLLAEHGPFDTFTTTTAAGER